MNEEYTFTFDKNEEKRFRTILDRLDPDEYVIVEDIHPVDADNRYSELTTMIRMEPRKFLMMEAQTILSKLLSG